MAVKKTTRKPVKASKVFSTAERDAMTQRAREVQAERGGADMEAEVLAKIAEMDASDRAMAQRIHAIIKAKAPSLKPRLWYGMPAYAKDGKVLCFFQDARKFKYRYATLGFQDVANLDEGSMWATGFALKKVTPVEEAKIADLLKKALA